MDLQCTGYWLSEYYLFPVLRIVLDPHSKVFLIRILFLVYGSGSRYLKKHFQMSKTSKEHQTIGRKIFEMDPFGIKLRHCSFQRSNPPFFYISAIVKKIKNVFKISVMVKAGSRSGSRSVFRFYAGPGSVSTCTVYMLQRD